MAGPLTLLIGHIQHCMAPLSGGWQRWMEKLGSTIEFADDDRQLKA
jgi:hypothetical protein